MAALPLLFFLIFSVGTSDALWCVCRSDLSNNPSVLQKTIDYACGAGADCTPIVQTGACYNPNTVVAHCSYAVNSYFQKNGQTQLACNFSGTAAISSTDPSYTGCSFPSTASAAGTSTTPTSTSGTPTSFSPTTGTTMGGTTTTGGIMGGLGPTGSSFDSSGGADSSHLPKTTQLALIFSILFSLALSVV